MSSIPSVVSSDKKPSSTEKKSRFSLFSGLKDRFSKSTPRKVLKTITSVMQNQPEESEKLKGAALMFSELEGPEKETVLVQIEEMLDHAADNCWQSELASNQVYNIAYFLSKAAPSIDSMDDFEVVYACLSDAAVSQQAESTSSAFREMQSMAVVALYDLGERSEECWSELLANTKTRRTALLVMLDMEDAKAEGLGWGLLRKNLGMLKDSIISSNSTKRNQFLMGLMDGGDVKQACMAFEMAAQVNGHSVMAATAQQITLSDSVDREIWLAATEFLHISSRLSEIEKKGEQQIDAVADLAGIIMSGHEYLRPLMEKQYRIMESRLANGTPDEKVSSLISMSILASASIGDMVYEDQIQSLVNGLIDADDSDGQNAIMKNALRLSLPIARSNSKRRDKLISDLFSSRDQKMVRAGFNISINFKKPEEAIKMASDIVDGKSEEMKSEAAWFLETMDLIEQLEFADDRQYDAANKLIDLYLSNPSMIGIMLEISEEMEGIVIEAANDAKGTGSGADVSKPIEIIQRLMGIGIMPQSINMQYSAVE